MTGAINYVRREGRFVMKYYLVVVISIYGGQTWRKRSFYHLQFTPFDDVALFNQTKPIIFIKKNTKSVKANMINISTKSQPHRAYGF